MASFLQLQEEVKRRSTRNQGGTQFDDASKFAINASLFRTAREAFWRCLRRAETFPTVVSQEEYNLPVQCGHRMFIYHEANGSPQKLDYITEQSFREYSGSTDQTGTPRCYRMWGEDMTLAQPTSASVVTISSSSALDTSVPVTIFGIVSGYPDYEIITVTGTSGVPGLKSFTTIDRVVKSATSVGRITATTNSAAVTVAVLPVGSTTTAIMRPKVQLWPIPDQVITMNVLYYKEIYKLINNGDVHEMGDQFDEAIILLAVAKVNYEQDKGEGDQFFALWQDEIKSLKRTNVDKTDFMVTLQRSNYNRGYWFGRGFSPSQAGSNYGYPSW